MDAAVPDWLPACLEFNQPGAPWDGDWARYVEEVYRLFQESLARPIRNDSLRWRGVRLALKKYPQSQAKESTFWHLVSEGDEESERTPCLSRCARICWPGAMIPRPEEPSVLVWLREHQGKRRIQVYLHEERYLLVLDHRRTPNGDEYILPWTAYVVEQEHSHRKLLAAYQAWKKQGSPLPGTP